MAAALLLRCVLGPRLYRLHCRGEGSGHDYQPSALERRSDAVLQWASWAWSFTFYSSPLLMGFMYRRGLLHWDRTASFTQILGSVILLLLGVTCLRGLGRWQNPEYLQFITVLEQTKQRNAFDNKKLLARYDFEFSAWPVDFSWNEGSEKGATRGPGAPLLSSADAPRPRGGLAWIRKLPCQMISYMLAHTLGRRLVFPGSVSLLQKMVAPQLLQGRAKLIEEHQGQRACLLAQDGNRIDTVFIDRRRQGSNHARTLVVCSEGNAGFYELGVMATPLEAGYSVLGWNHPGFAGSTGVPFPQAEANAMDVVMQYATERLGFQPTQIVLYAWSIGGFPATWAAMSYPEVSGLVLDASFDDIVPLATKVMPNSWGSLVVRTVRDYLNLNNADQLCRYPGPVILIRRTRDEIISTIPEDPSTNRGNELLRQLLKHRYPNLVTKQSMESLRQWLAVGDPVNEVTVYSAHRVDEEWCASLLKSYAHDHPAGYPWSIGEELSERQKTQLVMYLARKYMKNVEMTHCSPLPASEFTLPWVP
ncbi:phosphatidylserine lipase ABHD16A [Petromyzon marinus]|uniref:phosphatidylserine lipase ABHD16A n=1 Tax=Petromyzon marinus TaxID=7757 RepID=UPI003F72E4FD